MAHQVGDRVGAIRGSDDEHIYFYGWGVYAGDHPRPGTNPDEIPEDERGFYLELAASGSFERDAAFLTDMIEAQVVAGERTREQGDTALAAVEARRATEAAMTVEERALDSYRRTIANPKIVLDDGGSVFGYECWWGSTERVEAMFAGRSIVLVPAPHT